MIINNNWTNDTHTQKKFDEIKNKKKEEEAEQGVNYLSQEKQKRRNNGDTKKPTIYYTQTHSLIGGKAEKKIVFSYVYFRVV